MTSSVTTVPDGLGDLLQRPLVAHLATVRADGSPQVNPMWFAWDGELVRFTHTATRRKYRNVRANPAVSISIVDPDDPYRYVEIRGIVERVDPDPTGSLFVELAERYRPTFLPRGAAPPDAADRVVLVVRPVAFSHNPPPPPRR